MLGSHSRQFCTIMLNTYSTYKEGGSIQNYLIYKHNCSASEYDIMTLSLLPLFNGICTQRLKFIYIIDEVCADCPGHFKGFPNLCSGEPECKVSITCAQNGQS